MAQPDDRAAPRDAASIPDAVRRAAARWPHDEAVVDGDVRLSFRALEAMMVRAVRAMVASGVEPGDRVALWAPNRWQWIVAALGVHGAGGWLVPVNTRFKGEEAAHLLRTTRARMLVTVSDFLDTDYVGMLEAVDPTLDALHDVVLLDEGWDDFLARGADVSDADAHAAIDRVARDDVADVVFTSGTTGTPRGVPITHGQSLRFYDVVGSELGLRRGDRYLIVNPFFHCFGYKAGWLLCVMRGATTVPLAVFDAATVVDLIERERISVLAGAPTLLWGILDREQGEARDLSSLRIGFVGAAIVPAELLRRMRAELPFERVTCGYGLTESSAVCSITRPDDDPEYVAEWSAGHPIDGVEVKVVDGDGRALPPGEAGELMIRGGNVMAGYYQDPEATATVLEPDGWLHSGDVAVLNERGDIRITDRTKDLYISGGFNVSPAEVESLLLGMDDVSQVAVVGVPDARLGEVGAAFVVPRPGSHVTPVDVVAWAREHVANYKVPRQVILVDVLPLNAAGKVLKGELRGRLLA